MPPCVCVCMLVCMYVCVYVCRPIHACVYVCSHPHPPTFKKVNLSLASLHILLLFSVLPSLVLLELLFYMSAPIAMQEVCLLGVYMEMYMCNTSIQTHRSTSPIINRKKSPAGRFLITLFGAASLSSASSSLPSASSSLSSASSDSSSPVEFQLDFDVLHIDEFHPQGALSPIKEACTCSRYKSLSRRTSYVRRPSCLRAVSESQVGLLESCMVLACIMSILWPSCKQCCCIVENCIPNWNALVGFPARAPKPNPAPMVPVPDGPPSASWATPGGIMIPCPASGPPQGFGKGAVLGIPNTGTVAGVAVAAGVAAGVAAQCVPCCRASHSLPFQLSGVPHFLLAYLS